MKSKYPITGTFIDEVTYDIPASNWSNEQWAADLDHMKEVGMDTLVIMRAYFITNAFIPLRFSLRSKKKVKTLSALFCKRLKSVICRCI